MAEDSNESADRTGELSGNLRGAPVIGSDGERLGRVVDFFSDQLTGRSEWLVLAAEGNDDERGRRFVPLIEAVRDEEGVRVPYDLDLISSAPDVGAAGHLNVDDEAQLYAHYGLDPWEHGAKSGGRTGGTPTGVPLPPHSDAGPDRSPGDDGAVV